MTLCEMRPDEMPARFRAKVNTGPMAGPCQVPVGDGVCGLMYQMPTGGLVDHGGHLYRPSVFVSKASVRDYYAGEELPSRGEYERKAIEHDMAVMQETIAVEETSRIEELTEAFNAPRASAGWSARREPHEKPRPWWKRMFGGR